MAPYVLSWRPEDFYCKYLGAPDAHRAPHDATRCQKGTGRHVSIEPDAVDSVVVDAAIAEAALLEAAFLASVTAILRRVLITEVRVLVASFIWIFMSVSYLSGSQMSN